jgi:TonB family protein
MALSKDCTDYRDRQQTRTQRWVLWGILGATGIHVGMLPLLRWLPSDAALLRTEDRIQVVVMPPSPEAIAETAALADTASPSALAPADVEASSPMPQNAVPPAPAVAVTPTASLPEITDSALPDSAEPVTEEANSEPEMAEAESEPDVEESAADDPEASDTTVEEESDPEPTGETPEPDDVESAIAEAPATTDDESDTETAAAESPEDHETADVPGPALSGNSSTLETSTSGFSDALSRLLGSDSVTETDASTLGNSSRPSGAATADVARNTGPEPSGESAVGNESGEDADGASGETGESSRTVSCRQCSRPDYPAAALDAGIEGQPVVSVQFDAAGNVIGVTLEQSSGNAALDQAALSSLQSWQFETGGQGGSVSVEIPFVIEGSERHQEAQQQGDREAATVRNETPAAEASPANQPVQSAADTPAALPDAIDVAPESESAASDDDANEDAAAPETAADAEAPDPESDTETVDDFETSTDEAAPPAANEDAPADAIPEPVPASPISEPAPLEPAPIDPASDSSAAEPDSEADNIDDDAAAD